ncbi:MAG: hypothetical protein SGI90_05250 [Candidatus Eisenbacteria bacterium]|nr:hypothetical protein [Candidatus Eisenbacteria bacterium]
MTPRSIARFAFIVSIFALIGMTAARPAPLRRQLPRLLFVARTPDPAGRVPGLGPSGRFLAHGGRLMVREANGRVRPFLDPRPGEPPLFDVSDPAVSWDARTIVFSGTAGPGKPWRLFTCDAAGHGVRPLLPGDDDREDIDPVWLPEGRIAFASTRFRQTAEQGGVRATNLHSVWPDGSDIRRLTTDRNGAEEPTVDPRDGRLVYARWWFNRYHPSVVPADTLTTDETRAMPADPVDLWHAISIRSDGDGMRLAGGWPRIRTETMAYQPSLLSDGTLVGVQADRGSLLASMPHATGETRGPGPHRLVAYPGGFARSILVAERGISPCALPDDRLVFSAPGPGGDLALYLVRRPGEKPVMIADTEGMDDLDPALFLARPVSPALDVYLPPPPRDAPVSDRASLDDLDWTFRFDCLNVFANGEVDSPFPDAPKLARGVRIRFFAVLDRPGAPGDSIVLVREAPLTATGSVHEHEMPADTPMFEQLIDSDGRVLRGSSGPAHVPGFNFGRFGSGTKCVGCHSGHSAMPVPKNYESATWTNVAPSAVLTTLGVMNPRFGTRPLVDRRAKGPIDDVACRLVDPEKGRVRLAWPFPIEVREVILYSSESDRGGNKDAGIRLTDITFLHADRPVHHDTVTRALAPAGTHVVVEALQIDALDIQFRRGPGRAGRHPGGAIAEIAVIGRLIDD